MITRNRITKRDVVLCFMSFSFRRKRRENILRKGDALSRMVLGSVNSPNGRNVNTPNGSFQSFTNSQDGGFSTVFYIELAENGFQMAFDSFACDACNIADFLIAQALGH